MKWVMRDDVDNISHKAAKMCGSTFMQIHARSVTTNTSCSSCGRSCRGNLGSGCLQVHVSNYAGLSNNPHILLPAH
jgi:hypothetical protein